MTMSLRIPVIPTSGYSARSVDVAPFATASGPSYNQLLAGVDHLYPKQAVSVVPFRVRYFVTQIP